MQAMAKKSETGKRRVAWLTKEEARELDTIKRALGVRSRREALGKMFEIAKAEKRKKPKK